MTRRFLRLLGAGLVGLLALGFMPGAASAAAPDPPGAISISTYCANASSTNPFSDVSQSGQPTFYNAILCLRSAGITQGSNSAGTTFTPDGSVSRGQMAAFVARLMDVAKQTQQAGKTVQALPPTPRRRSSPTPRATPSRRTSTVCRGPASSPGSLTGSSTPS